MRTVHLPATGKRVTLASDVRFVRLAKDGPDRALPHGVSCWWTRTGEGALRQFHEGAHERINHAVPHRRRGKKEKGD